MKIEKPIRALLSFILAFAMIIPSASKVEAGATHPVDANAIIVQADITGISTNNHTVARAIWTYQDYVYLMIDSTHPVESVVIGTLSSTDRDIHGPGQQVTVGSTIYKPDKSKGNTKDAHLTIVRFSLATILSTIGLNESGQYPISVYSEVGGGHDIIGGTLTITVPKAKAVITKTWDGGPKEPVKMQLYREYLNGSGDTKVGDQFTLTTDNPSKTFTDLKYTDNLGRIYQYYVTEVNLGAGYTPTYNIEKTFVSGVYIFTIGVTNKYTPPMTNIKITKIWKDETPDARPSTITYKLYADGAAEPVRTGSTSSSEGWMLTFKDLPLTTGNGTPIVYTVKEDPVPGYATSIDGFTVTNVRTEKTSIEVTKLWKDAGGPARPESVTVNLLADGSKLKDIQLTEAGGWKATFTDIPKFDENGKLIQYTVTENAVAGYTSSVDGFNITNTRAEKISIPVEKLWKDDGPEGRPQRVVINLMAGEDLVKSLELTAAMDWKGSFTDVDKFDSEGNLISYTITEEEVDGYRSDIKGFKVTNTRVGNMDIKVEKSWLDAGNTAGRPESITIDLFAGDLKVDSAELTAEMGWQHTFKDRPMYDIEGKAISYSIKEKAVEGYKSTVDGFKVTNLRVGITEVSAEKIWKDDNDAASRPESITVNLLADGIEVKDMAVTKDMDWKYTFKDLPKYDETGKLIVYTITEDAIEGYVTSVDGFKITNLRTGKVDIPVVKIWKDENPEGRPESITVNLFADGIKVGEKEITSEMEWKYTFTGMERYDENGKAITYTITENSIPGYKGVVSGYTLTNTITAEKDIPVQKIWKDDNVTSERPQTITVTLLANGKVVDTEEITEAMSWKYTFEDKPVYDENGKTIVYTVKELDVEGYISSVDGFDITNVRTGKTEVPVEKIWKDANEDDRPESITVNLLANGEKVKEMDITADMDWKYTFRNLAEFDENGKAYVYTITEEAVAGYTSSINGFLITNLRSENADIPVEKFWLDNNETASRPESVTIYLYADGELDEEVQLTAENSWKHTFTDKPVYNEEGIKIAYTVKEKAAAGYYTTIDGFKVTNLRVGRTEIKVDKIWLDDDDEDARPESITVNLLANGKEVRKMDITEEMNWTYTFMNLPKYDNMGKLFVYTVTENAVPGYATTVDGLKITNLRTGEIDIPAAKVWLDGTDPSGRPESVTVRLFADDEEVESLVLDAGNSWKGIFEDLPEFDENGARYIYTLKEDAVAGYTTKITFDPEKGFVVTNLRTAVTDIEVTKIWKDNGENRPEEITVHLFRNGEEIREVKLTADENGDWIYLFTDLPVYDKLGEIYTYTVGEEAVDGYETAVDEFIITNLRSGRIEIPVEKKWLDNGVRDIDEITVRLMKEVVSLPPYELDRIAAPQAVSIEEVMTMKLNEENDWKDIFRDLPEFDENGLQIRYFVEEVEVPGYVSSVEQNEDGSYTITNLRTGETSVSGMKYWMEEEGTSLRPGYITVILLQNGEEFARTAIGEENEWSYSFENLAEFDEKGIAYEYTIDEVEVDGYRTEIIGTDIHNIRTGEIDIPVEKIWKDNGVRDIEEITVHLYRRIHEMDREFSEMTMDEMIDHTHVAMAVLSEENDWTFTFENLPEFDEHGMPIEYYLEEVSAEGYESIIIQNEDGSFTVTNSRVGTVEIEGQKSWFDEGEEGRPESITAILTRNGEEIDRRVVTVENEWNYSFGELPEFDENGIAYTYKVEELPVEGYNTFYAGYDIQNVRTGMVNVNGEKTWDDLSERPENIVINLLQNGVEIDEVTLSKDEDDKWTYSFTELPEFDEDGKAFVYTVTEDPVEGYEATVTGYNILNRQLRAALRIVKVDDFDFPVEGVVFEVEDEEGNLVFRGTTDEDGILETVLPLGTYIVTEISAPEDYIMDPEPKTVILDEDGEVFELTVVNILEFEDVNPKPLPPTPAPPKPQPQLPSTGAENGVIWYGLGILMALGGVLLLKKRRNI